MEILVSPVKEKTSKGADEAPLDYKLCVMG